MPRAALALALTSVLALAALAGCGGEDGDGGGDRARAAYVAEGDALCRQVNARIARLNRRAADDVRRAGGQDAATLAALAPVLAQGLAIQRDAERRFAAIAPPEADRDEVAELVAANRRQTTLVARLAETSRRGDATGFLTTSNRLVVERRRTARIARGIGFRECGGVRDGPAQR